MHTLLNVWHKKVFTGNYLLVEINSKPESDSKAALLYLQSFKRVYKYRLTGSQDARGQSFFRSKFQFLDLMKGFGSVLEEIIQKVIILFYN